VAAATAAAPAALSTEVVHDVSEDPATLAQIKEVHRRGVDHLTGCFSRTDQYWKRWITHAARPGAGVTVHVVRDGDGTIVGYGVIRLGGGPVFGGIVQVTEFFTVAADAERKQACFLKLLGDVMAACEEAPTRVRVSSASVDPVWMAGVAAAPPPAAVVAAGPVKEGTTLMRAGAGPHGSVIWADHGQMFRPGPRFGGADVGVACGDLFARYTFLALDAF